MTKVEKFDFGDTFGPVPASRHPNADGSLGGWVAQTAEVDEASIVHKDATVAGRSYVKDSIILGKVGELSTVIRSQVGLGASVINSTVYRCHIHGSSVGWSGLYGTGGEGPGLIEVRGGSQIRYLYLRQGGLDFRGARIRGGNDLLVIGPIGSEHSTMLVYRADLEGAYEPQCQVGCWEGPFRKLMPEVRRRAHRGILTDAQVAEYAVAAALASARAKNWGGDE